MAACSGILAWRSPWTAEPGRGYSPRGHKESDTTEPACTPFPHGADSTSVFPVDVRGPDASWHSALTGLFVGRCAWRAGGAAEGGVPAQVSPPSPCPSPVLLSLSL